MKQFVQSTLKKFNLRVVKDNTFDEIPVEASDFERAIMNRCHKFSMTGNLRMWSIIQAMKHIKQHNISGDFVECGVWKGANLVLMQNMLEHMDMHNKRIYGYDTFEGMSDSSEFDIDFQDREWSNFSKTIKRDEKVINAWCVAGIDLVRSLYNKNTNANENLNLIKGDVLETLSVADNVPKKISLLRLDTDFYESTKKELDVLYPRLEKGGVLIIDDYGHWKGARKAVDDYFKGQYKLMHVIDYTCRMIIKDHD